MVIYLNTKRINIHKGDTRWQPHSLQESSAGHTHASTSTVVVIQVKGYERAKIAQLNMENES